MYSYSDATAQRRRKPGQEASRFKSDLESGKMIIDEGSDDNAGNAAKEDVEGGAYRESLTSADGFTRGPGGRIKFNKDTKKRRRADEEIEDVEMADVERTVPEKKTKKKTDPKFGHEFKAKVRRRV